MQITPRKIIAGLFLISSIYYLKEIAWGLGFMGYFAALIPDFKIPYPLLAILIIPSVVYLVSFGSLLQKRPNIELLISDENIDANILELPKKDKIGFSLVLVGLVLIIIALHSIFEKAFTFTFLENAQLISFWGYKSIAEVTKNTKIISLGSLGTLISLLLGIILLKFRKFIQTILLN